MKYYLPKETVAAIMILYRNTKVKVRSPDGDTEYFDIVAGVLQGDTSSVYYQERHSKGSSTAPFSSSCLKCKIPGWALRLMKSKIMQTRMTWKTFTAVWRRFMVPPVPAHPRFWVQMEQDPGQVDWAFQWCTKQAIFYQWLRLVLVSESLQPWEKFR